VAIANGTLAAAVGLGLQLWIPGVVLWIVGHSLAVWGARVDPQFMPCSPGTSSTARCWTCREDAMLNLAEYRQRPALLADWLPWAGLVAPGVVLNKDGFQRTARFRGPDLDSATQGELIATSARLNNALRRLGSGWALFIEAERRSAADYHSFPEPLSWLVDEERRAAFEESGNHFESGYHLTLVYLPPRNPAPARRAAVREPSDRRRGLARAADAFVAETDRIFDLLDGVMPESPGSMTARR
jgi:type IV secretion system protein VirB4